MFGMNLSRCSRSSLGVTWREPITLPPVSLRANDRRESLHNYEHKKLIDAIARLDEVPTDPEAFSVWILAEAHLTFLRQNEHADELVVYASGEYTFVHSVVVPNDQLTPVDKEVETLQR